MSVILYSSIRRESKGYDTRLIEKLVTYSPVFMFRLPPVYWATFTDTVDEVAVKVTKSL